MGVSLDELQRLFPLLDWLSYQTIFTLMAIHLLANTENQLNGLGNRMNCSFKTVKCLTNLRQGN